MSQSPSSVEAALSNPTIATAAKRNTEPIKTLNTVNFVLSQYVLNVYFRRKESIPVVQTNFSVTFAKSATASSSCVTSFSTPETPSKRTTVT